MTIGSADGQAYEDEMDVHLDRPIPTSSEQMPRKESSPITSGSPEASTMTHQTEQDNPAKPYLDTFKRFMHGGLSEAIYGEDRSTLAKILSSESANAALGLFGGRMSPIAVQSAKAMEAAKFSPITIKEMTGLERGAEGMWRREFSDEGSKLNTSSMKVVGTSVGGKTIRHGTVGDVLEHPELYKAYPEAKDIPLLETPYLTPGSEGEYDTFHKAIKLKPDMDPDKSRKILLHEIQHWIQDKEGFSLGHQSSLNEEYVDKMKGYLLRKYGEKQINKIYNNPNIEEARGQAQDLLDESDYLIYKGQAHEQEAFNVMKRANMTAKERKHSLGLDTEEFPRGEQIIYK